MASIDKLVEEITDAKLREAVGHEVSLLKRSKQLGLVFEDHAETAALAGLPIEIGTLVERSDTNTSAIYEVKAITNRGRTAVIIDPEGNEEKCDVLHLLVHKRLGEPIYPGLTSMGRVKRSEQRPYHAVINGENFHSLQLLTYLVEDRVDCIYIDPPYNTGARDWKYNNRYVDLNDQWRHSKWLSFMEKRLRLAKRLLKSNGVLIVTVDEHEVNNLGVLLRQIFRAARVQMVTIVMNTAGSMSPGLFSRAEEYAYFCFFGNAKPSPMASDLLASSVPVTQFWFPLFRSRGLNDRPSKRPNLVYPIAVDPRTLTVCATGRSLKERSSAGEVRGDLDKWKPDLAETIEGKPVVWPILDSGEVTTAAHPVSRTRI